MPVLAPTAPAMPIDQLVQRLVELADAFKQSPTPELLRQLERLAQQIMARSRQLTPALAALLRPAITGLVAVITAPATVVVVGTTVGTLALWWLFLEMLSDALSHPVDYDGFAERMARALAIALSQLLGGAFNEDCYKKLLEQLKLILRFYIAPGMIISNPSALGHEVRNALIEYIKCLFPKYRDHELTDQFARVIDEYVRRLLSGMGLGLLFGILGSGTAEAGESKDDDLSEDEKREIAKKLGLHGIPLGNGLASNEVDPDKDGTDAGVGKSGKKTDGSKKSDPVPVPDKSLINIDPATPLDLFSDVELKLRKKLIKDCIADLENQIEADRNELKKLEKNPDNDSSRADLLRLRIESMQREVERLKAALQNAQRECQIRELEKR